MIKDILALVDDGRACAPFLRDLLNTALTLESHVDIAVLTPLPLTSPRFAPAGGLYIPEFALRAEARMEMARVRELVERWGTRAEVWGLHDDVAWLTDDLRHSNPIADLVVVGSKTSWEIPWLRRRVLESTLLYGGTPLLLLPDGHTLPHLRHAVLGWKPSPEAVRAMHELLRLIQPGARIDLVTIGDKPEPDALGRDPETALVRHLVRHDVLVEHHWLDDGTAPAAQLQAFAERRGADLLAVGAFAHSRVREILLGGVTRDLLDESRLPVLLAH
ncbi:universal stress protein [Sphingomonas hylomeconis]|uniref:Universal stress protein n=1 Tax=Sphingomonas hylomeconis TaxID=1395958 RepID=A0ABV7SWM9_9SPHN|nr:universal stress protein [Sphingomonas hylomeconis]